MTRRRISDLIQQEAQKPNSKGDSIQDTTNTTSEQDTKAEEPQIQVPEQTSDNTNTMKTELEATVTELRAALDQAHRKEGSLEQRIADLQSALDEQKALAQKLQKELNAAKPIKAELEEAKKAALGLAEANIQLIEKVDLLSKKPERTTVERKKLEWHDEPIAQEKFVPPADFAKSSWLL